MKRERAKERRECVSITKKLCTLLLNKKNVHCYSCVHVLLCLLNLDAVYIQIQQILYAEYIHILYAVHIHRIHTLYAMCIGRTNTYNGVQTTPHQRCQYTQTIRFILAIICLFICSIGMDRTFYLSFGMVRKGLVNHVRGQGNFQY